MPHRDNSRAELRLRARPETPAMRRLRELNPEIAAAQAAYEGKLAERVRLIVEVLDDPGLSQPEVALLCEMSVDNVYRLVRQHRHGRGPAARKSVAG